MSLRNKIDEEFELTVGDSRYLLIPEKEVLLHFEGEGPALVLVYTTVAGQSITKAAIRQFRANVLDKDDVFRSSFYTNLIFYGGKQHEIEIEPEAFSELAAWNVQTQSSLATRAQNSSWTIFALDAPKAGTNGRVIVPSRCYYNPSPSRPFDGARISVKDNIDIAGHKTTLCNRAWIQLYPEKSKNAACVKKLIEAGAVIVGKVKLQAMIMREEPLECVEFTAPFNPRADGYQVPSGSSHASAAGIGSYAWLDFSLGSDTNGSGRKPASFNGCFSIRPSTGITNNEGVVAYFRQFDMPVFSGRDISRFAEFISVWYGDSPTHRAPGKASVKILYPSDYLPTPNPAQTQVVDKFFSGLESALGINRTEISLAELWEKHCPDGEQHRDIATYLEFLISLLRNVGKAISQEECDECWRRSEIYRHWLLENVFKADDEDTVTVMILPIGAGKPNYRDAELPPNGLLSGYVALNMSPITRAPEVTAPVGDIAYDSIVTEREEPLPVAVSVIGPPGTDLILVDLVEKGMKGAGLATEVKTGSSMY
ncbi:hypothetical protein HAV15_000346 [Penicillium sp. str. |nr:hypothetical protein HAV15_000346 [Penicillium sp. str. \